MDQGIMDYNGKLTGSEREICDRLSAIIDGALPGAESRVWHAHPVWFLEGNPVAGYSRLKDSVQLLFWSGQSFEEPALLKEGKFKASGIRYTSQVQINTADLNRWLQKCRQIQWDYRNIVKRKGLLERLK
jgi:hypothetical protein